METAASRFASETTASGFGRRWDLEPRTRTEGGFGLWARYFRHGTVKHGPNHRAALASKMAEGEEGSGGRTQLTQFPGLRLFKPKAPAYVLAW